MRNNDESKCVGRITTILIIAILAVTPIAMGIWCLIGWHQKIRDSKSATAIMMYFQGRLNLLTADEAAKEWEFVKTEINIPLDMVPSYNEWNIYIWLGDKYLREERYGLSLNMYLKALKGGGKINENLLIYLAGLAGHKSWLRERIAIYFSDKQKLQNAFIKANLEWASGDYEALIKLVDIKVNDETTIQLSDNSEELLAWLSFIKAQALIKSGKDNLAYGILLEKVYPVISKIELNRLFKVRLTIIVASVAERAKHYEDALLFAELARRYFKSYPDRSWDKDRNLINEMIIRLKGFRVTEIQGQIP